MSDEEMLAAVRGRAMRVSKYGDSPIINEVVWKNMSTEELKDFSEELFQIYRSKGFPYYRLTDEQTAKELLAIQRYIKSSDFSVDSAVIPQTMHGLGLCWSYMDHSWEVPIGKLRTPYEVFHDDELFRNCIRRRLQRGTYISDSGIRKALRGGSGVQSVSNFRPTAAALLYKTYAGDGVVWDMSSGYGGRLLGAISSGAIKHYYGTEPCTPTINGLERMVADLDRLGLASHMEVTLIKQGSETRLDMIPDGGVSLCFTSPPYFNAERYSDEGTQSYVKFPTIELWNDGFLRGTLDNCYRKLTSAGVLLLNVANVRTAHPTLEYDSVRIAESVGFKLEKTLHMTLSSINKGGYKYEPIFVFAKG